MVCVQNVSSEIMFPESKNIHSQIYLSNTCTLVSFSHQSIDMTPNNVHACIVSWCDKKLHRTASVHVGYPVSKHVDCILSMLLLDSDSSRGK